MFSATRTGLRPSNRFAELAFLPRLRYDSEARQNGNGIDPVLTAQNRIKHESVGRILRATRVPRTIAVLLSYITAL